MHDDRLMTWLAALDARHLSDLTQSEVTRALRALSSCYVERRETLPSGGPLGTAGKRAAFALFYAPLHFFVVREIVRALNAADGIRRVLDLGCGTGTAGAALALEAAQARVEGVDRNPWAVAEANWTYARLGIAGKAVAGSIEKWRLSGATGTAVLAAYALNELPDTSRDAVRERMLEAADQGATLLIVEPIARRQITWWDDWVAVFAPVGGVEAEWRFPVALPARQRALAKGAGLSARELTARTLFVRRGK